MTEPPGGDFGDDDMSIRRRTFRWLKPGQYQVLSAIASGEYELWMTSDGYWLRHVDGMSPSIRPGQITCAQLAGGVPFVTPMDCPWNEELQQEIAIAGDDVRYEITPTGLEWLRAHEESTQTA